MAQIRVYRKKLEACEAVAAKHGAGCEANQKAFVDREMAAARRQKRGDSSSAQTINLQRPCQPRPCWDCRRTVQYGLQCRICQAYPMHRVCRHAHELSVHGIWMPDACTMETPFLAEVRDNMDKIQRENASYEVHSRPRKVAVGDDDSGKVKAQ